MKIIYTPKDNPVEGREEIDVDLDDLWVGEVKLLEKVMKVTIAEFGEWMNRGSFTHMMALMWIYRRRSNMELRIDDMDDLIRMSELEPEYEEGENPEGDEGPKGEDLPEVDPEPKAKAKA